MQNIDDLVRRATTDRNSDDDWLKLQDDMIQFLKENHPEDEKKKFYFILPVIFALSLLLRHVYDIIIVYNIIIRGRNALSLFSPCITPVREIKSI